ncbi:uncharacterized protein LOC144440570 [Glandiceps talaboti]
MYCTVTLYLPLLSMIETLIVFQSTFLFSTIHGLQTSTVTVTVTGTPNITTEFFSQCEITCVNGGRCSNNKCFCKWPYYGKYCQHLYEDDLEEDDSDKTGLGFIQIAAIVIGSVIGVSFLSVFCWALLTKFCTSKYGCVGKRPEEPPEEESRSSALYRPGNLNIHGERIPPPSVSASQQNSPHITHHTPRHQREHRPLLPQTRPLLPSTTRSSAYLPSPQTDSDDLPSYDEVADSADAPDIPPPSYEMFLRLKFGSDDTDV